MSYLHDVFISYRRERAWTPWTRDYFKRELTSYLQPDLGRPPDIFVDERLEVGADWVERLATHLARSKVLVALLSRDYFDSPWCVHELDLMFERAGGRAGLFIPVIVHDCDGLADPVGRVQAVNISAYRYTTMNKPGTLFDNFTAAVKSLSPAIARVVELVERDHPFDAAWIDVCTMRFNDVHAARQHGQMLAPKYVVLPVRPPHSAPPRLTI